MDHSKWISGSYVRSCYPDKRGIFPFGGVACLTCLISAIWEYPRDNGSGDFTRDGLKALGGTTSAAYDSVNDDQGRV